MRHGFFEITDDDADLVKVAGELHGRVVPRAALRFRGAADHDRGATFSRGEDAHAEAGLFGEFAQGQAGAGI